MQINITSQTINNIMLDARNKIPDKRITDLHIRIS